MKPSRWITLAAAIWIALPCGAQPVGSLEYLGLATIESGTIHDGTLIGGLSGIAWDQETGQFYAISDDPSWRSPSRFYTLEIDLADGRLEHGGVTIEGVTPLTDRRGETFERLVIDGEGIALTPRRTLMISSEGNIERGVPPSIREVGIDGRERRRFRMPRKWRPGKRRPRGPRHNSAFEALTIAPNGEHYLTATEVALLQDGPATDIELSSAVRIARFRYESGRPIAEYLYRVGPVVRPPVPADAFRINGLVELLALDDETLLALERSYSVGVGNSIRIFLVSTAGADDVRRIGSLAQRPDIRPVSKRLLIDLDDLGVELDNVEGMTLGPRLEDGRRTLILVSDDNFSDQQTTQIFAFALDPSPTPIAVVQGAGHRSPLEGRWLADVRGIVTATDLEGRRSGFWLQDPRPDGDQATSEGIFVSPLGGGARVAVGDRVSIAGRAIETGFPGALTVTRIEARRIGVDETDLALPEPIDLGGTGRPVPKLIDDDGLGRFEPAADAIDLYESLEGMRVRVDSGTVVGATNRFGLLTVAVNGGDGVPTARGGLLITEDDPNTERLQIDGSLAGGAPEAEVGQLLAEPVTGVLDYDFGNFRLISTGEIRIAAHENPLLRNLVPGDADLLRVVTYNVWNLDVRDDAERFADLGGEIVSAGRPDIVALQEIQDDSGTQDDGTVTAERTLARLVEGVAQTGGPAYEVAQLDPANNADGGAPGGNIRVAFLYDPVRVRLTEEGSRLGPRNPARLFEGNPAFEADPETGFEATRKPLAAEFEFNGRRLVAINVHLKSKRGDDPLFGARQPPLRKTEAQRSAQTRALGEYVAALLADDPEALVMVLGDFNEHEFRPPMRLLERYGLTNLIERVEREQRYTYNHEGNSQAIDHILATPALAATVRRVEAMRGNADFPDATRSSDHDPVAASFELSPPVE